MINRIKKAIQDRLYENCIDEYRKELRCQTDPYLLWVKQTEIYGAENIDEEEYPSLGVVYMEQCTGGFTLDDIKNEYIIFASKNGRISVRAFGEIMRYFDTHKDTNIVYPDEDVWALCEEEGDRPKADGDDELSSRTFPWTKPMWSPDTLFSFFYFGNIFAIRKSAFADIEWLGDKDYRKNIYDFALKATELGKRAGHIEKVLFHAYRRGKNIAEIEESLMHSTDFIGVGAEYDDIRIAAMERRGIKGKMAADSATGITYPIYEAEGNPLVSIIIPSKDNPETLKQCIRSVYNHTAYKNYEIIVVDNGSSARNRIVLDSFKNECEFSYIYQPMEFNFSKMCNIGVGASKGSYILFLNDDMEATEDLWLDRMLGQAALKHVGAVGAKLLYPNSTLIQHAGISNTIYGPGHKLKKMDDSVSYYYGRNRFVYDMIGVTAACLLIRRDYLKAIGGLYEGLAVAYNDVDLCFRLCTKGLYNVQRNDAVLYHHESLSRGDDMQDGEKLKRLLSEQELLYSRHKKFYHRDPFIGTLMNDGDPEYKCRWLEAYELADTTDYVEQISQGKKLPNERRMNNAIMVVTEDCKKERYVKKPYYLIKGWAYVPDMDNARYSFKLLFVNGSGQVGELPVQKRYRKDVAAILENQVNVDMTGFCCWIYEGALPNDTYDLWITAKDNCSRQRLYRNMEKQLEVK